jgi:predicted permease
MDKGVPIWRRYARLFGADPKADVRDEIRFHLEAKVDDLVTRGWSKEAARDEAERQFGDLERIQKMGEHIGIERERELRRRNFTGDLAQDLRYALRTLRAQTTFTIVSVLILALGIAANTAVFSVVNTVLFRPLPFPDAKQLVWFDADRGVSANMRQRAGLSAITYTVDAFEEYQRHNQSFQSVTSYNPFFGNGEMTMTGSGEPRHVLGLMIGVNFFQTLGVTPLRGRLLEPDEYKKGGRHAVLLSHGFWREQFGSDPSIVGKAVTLNKQLMTVVGVMPATFDFGSVFSPGLKADVFIPALFEDMRHWGNTLAVVGRLKPGLSVKQAQAEADVLFPQLRAANKGWWSDYSSTLTGLQEHLSGALRKSLLVLWCAVGLILLIVCVNLSNLQLVRATARSKEFAMRAALGAGRIRLLRQLLTESAVLAFAGSALGLALAYGVTFYLAHQQSIALPLLSSVAVDRTALSWTLMITVAATLLFGAVPGLRLWTGDVQEVLKSSGPGMTVSRAQERLRGLMVVSEVALACVLLISAGLLLRSFLNVLNVDLGFRPSQAVTMTIDYDTGGDDNRRGIVLQEILRNVAAIPGVESAGVTDMLPLGRNRAWGLTAKGTEYANIEQTGALVRIVTPGYIEAMGVRLRAGRDFSWSDTNKSQCVVIINEAAGRYYWAGDDPFGRLARTNGNDCRVIGVIADVRQQSVEAAAGPEMYLPVMQSDPEGAELVIRTRLPPQALAPILLKTLRSLNPNQPASELRALDKVVDHSVSPRRFFVWMVASFALLGLVLASLGIYGVISYSVTRQTQEIGIRVALGASSAQVRIGVIVRALRLAAIGAVAGAVASLVVGKWIESLLFRTTTTDVTTFAAIVFLLCAVSFVAGYIPARRASRIEPMVALRNS